MYRQDTWGCPSCESPITPLGSELPAHGCDTCGGMWLGPEATVHVMRGLDDAIDRRLVWSSHTLAEKVRNLSRLGHERVPSVPEDGRACPACAQPLSPIVVGGVRIDSCAAHGAYFDADEVARVVTTCVALRAYRNVEKNVLLAGPRDLFRAIAHLLAERWS
ncbi:MAG: zf-TFIIB domain-containing protein [Polyangiaceae bacterium]